MDINNPTAPPAQLEIPDDLSIPPRFRRDPVPDASVDPFLTEHVAAIRQLGQRVREDVVEIGRHLLEVEDRIGRDAYLQWLDVEFGWSDQTAYRFIHLYKAKQNPEFSTTLWKSELTLSSLYQLAAPNCPKTAREEVAERIEAGETPSCAEVGKTISRAKKKNGRANQRTKNKKNGDANHPPPAAEDDGATSGEKRKATYAAMFDEPETVTVELNTEPTGGLKTIADRLRNEAELTALLRAALEDRSTSGQILRLSEFNKILLANNVDTRVVKVRISQW